MATAKKKAVKKKSTASKEAVAPSPTAPGDLIKVKNISDRQINVRGGTLQPGDSGEATAAQLRQFPKHLEAE